MLMALRQLTQCQKGGGAAAASAGSVTDGRTSSRTRCCFLNYLHNSSKEQHEGMMKAKLAYKTIDS